MFKIKERIAGWIIKFVAKKMLGEDYEDDFDASKHVGVGEVKRYKTGDGREILEIDGDPLKTASKRRRRIK